MKATKLFTTAAVATLGFTLLAPTVLAKDAGDAKAYIGEGTITFEESGEKTDPIDPEIVDPVTPPVDPNENKGPLRMEFATTLDFGTQKATANKGVYNAQEIEVTKTHEDGTKEQRKRGNYVQVADQRALDDNGKTKGWKLTAKLDKQFATENDVTTLDGATLTYNNAYVNAPNGKKDEVTAKSGVTLKLGEDKEMANAEAGKGFGVFTIEYGRPAATADNQNGFDEDTKTSDKSVVLEVLPNTPLQAKAYKAEILWTMNEI